MAAQTPWVFEEHHPRHVSRDPVEAEFFHGAGADEQAFERTDSLIREALQNSLDARHDGAAVRVTFRLARGAEAIAGRDQQRYLEGLVDHLDVLDNEHVNRRQLPPLDYLVIEDFGTRGLGGDLRLTTDPQTRDQHEDFYWFWRNVGRSGKGGTDRGRWGLGKTVFQASSRINTVFGLTVRACDGRHLLMGQAVTRKHSIGGRTYLPEGFFCDPAGDRSGPQMPFVDAGELDAFRTAFRLGRRNEPGLSLVVAYPFATLDVRALLRSAIAHFFLPIMKGNLEVAFTGPDLPETVLNRESIRAIADGVDWDNGSRNGGPHRPPFDLAQWAVERQARGMPQLLDIAGDKTPAWDSNLFPPELLESSRASFKNGERIALRVPLTLLRRDSGRKPTWFDAFLERDEALTHGEDFYVRAGMTISGMSMLRRHRGWRGFMVVEDESLSSLLGDTEGPAHLEWRERPGDRRADRSWDKWSKRVGFVKQALPALLELLSPPVQEVMEDLLADVFGIEDPKTVGRKKVRKRKQRGVEPPPPPPPPPPPTRPRRYRMEKSRGGFSIADIDPDLKGLLGLRIRVAYDVPDGDPMRQWSEFDFKLEREGRSVQIAYDHAEEVSCRGNQLEVAVRPGFRIDVSGFNPDNDLFVKAVPILEDGEDSEEPEEQEVIP